MMSEKESGDPEPLTIETLLRLIADLSERFTAQEKRIGVLEKYTFGQWTYIGGRVTFTPMEVPKG